MLFNFFTTVFCIAFIQLLVSRAIYEAEDTHSARYLIRLINVVVVPLFFIFGLLLLIQIVGWLYYCFWSDRHLCLNR